MFDHDAYVLSLWFPQIWRINDSQVSCCAQNLRIESCGDALKAELAKINLILVRITPEAEILLAGA